MVKQPWNSSFHDIKSFLIGLMIVKYNICYHTIKSKHAYNLADTAWWYGKVLYFTGPLWRKSTHWGRDKMAAISQTAFSWMKIYQFRLRFHWNFFLRVQINNIPALVQIMAWRRRGNKPLSEPVMVSLLTHICVTRPQWVKICWLILFTNMHQYGALYERSVVKQSCCWQFEMCHIAVII